MSKKVSDKQIEELFAFCKAHYVPQYDLQLELVDHLASSIEEKWEQDPDLPFKEALNEVFSGFGIYGFSKLKGAKGKALRRKYNIMFRNYIVEFYKLPKIILTIAISILLYTAFKLINDNSIIAYSVAGLYILGGIYYLFYLYPKKYNINLVPGKSFLLNDHLKSITGSYSVFVVLPLNTLSIFINNESLMESLNTSTAELLLSVLLAFIGIVSYAWAVYLPKKIKEDFISEFPQFVKN